MSDNIGRKNVLRMPKEISSVERSVESKNRDIKSSF